MRGAVVSGWQIYLVLLSDSKQLLLVRWIDLGSLLN